MIISRTPFRISFFGGGTDYPAWFREHGGAVIGTTIDKHCFISIRHLPPFFEHRHRIVWSKIELVNEIADIQHPAVRAILRDSAMNEGVEITYNADLPARSGLGSSSSFTVGLLNALNALRGRMISKKDLASEAIRVEQDLIRDAVGSQDQIWAAYGGFNHIVFHADSSFEVAPVIVTAERRRELQDSLMLFFSGFSRDAARIAKKQIANMRSREDQFHAMRAQVDEALGILQDERRPIADLGRLMHEGWMMKRALADGVTTPQVDEIYEAGIKAGAVGGKLLGAGGGGFMLFVTEPERRQKLRNRLKDLIHVSLDFDADGSKIIVFDPDDVETATARGHAPPDKRQRQQKSR